MNISNIYLAYICNDIQNFNNYKIIDNLCYYKDELIGEIKETLNGNVLDVYLKPKKSLEYINLDFTITKTGVEFKD